MQIWKYNNFWVMVSYNMTITVEFSLGCSSHFTVYLHSSAALTIFKEGLKRASEREERLAEYS